MTEEKKTKKQSRHPNWKFEPENKIIGKLSIILINKNAQRFRLVNWQDLYYLKQEKSLEIIQELNKAQNLQRSLTSSVFCVGTLVSYMRHRAGSESWSHGDSFSTERERKANAWYHSSAAQSAPLFSPLMCRFLI